MNVGGDRVACAASAMLALGLASCVAPSTEIFVVVDTDMTPGVELDTIQIDANGPAGIGFTARGVIVGDHAIALPASTGVLVGSDPGLPIVVTARALHGSDTVATVQARVVPMAGETRVLPLVLRRACSGSASCAADRTCNESGACEPVPTTMATALDRYAPSASTARAVFVQDDFEAFAPTDQWSMSQPFGAWNPVIVYGHAQLTQDDGSQVLDLLPSSDPGAYVRLLSVASFGDFDATVRMRTVRPVATPALDYYIARILWHFRDPTHYYELDLSHDQWTVARWDPQVSSGHIPVASGSMPDYATGWHTVHLRQIGAHITVDVDTVPLADASDPDAPYLVGPIGLMAETAESHFDDVRVRAP